MSKIKFRLNKKWRLNKVCVLHNLELNKSQPKSGRLQQYSSPSPSPSTVARVGGCLISEAFPRQQPYNLIPIRSSQGFHLPPDIKQTRFCHIKTLDKHQNEEICSSIVRCDARCFWPQLVKRSHFTIFIT